MLYSLKLLFILEKILFYYQQIYLKYIIPPYAYNSSCCVTYILDSSNFLAIFKVYLIEKRMNGRETLVFTFLLFIIITELHPHSGVLIQNNNVSFCVWTHYVYHCEWYFFSMVTLETSRRLFGRTCHLFYNRVHTLYL